MDQILCIWFQKHSFIPCAYDLCLSETFAQVNHLRDWYLMCRVMCLVYSMVAYAIVPVLVYWTPEDGPPVPEAPGSVGLSSG